MITKNPTAKQMLPVIAAENGWTMVKDNDYSASFERPTLDSTVVDRITVYYSSRGYVVQAYFFFATGDRTLQHGRACFNSREAQGSNKRDTVHAWFEAPQATTKPKVAQILAKLGYAPILHTGPED